MFIELQTEAFTRTIKVNKNTTFQLTGTIGDSVISFEQPNGSGGWIDVVLDTVTQELSSSNTMVSFFAPATIRVNKPITVAEAGVMVVS